MLQRVSGFRRGTVVLITAAGVILSACVGPKITDPGPQIPTRDCPPGTLLGAGSTAQQGVIDLTIARYGAACRGANTVQYEGAGSGAGVTEFVNGLTHFAGSDSALTDEEQALASERCGANAALHLPMVVSPIGVAYSLEGVDELTLDADVTARIFAGDITRWNDSAIAALNPDVALPSEPITVVHRSDSSGTTRNFTAWLHAVAPEVWPENLVSENWKSSGQGAAKSDGVATEVADSPGAITYVEMSYAADYQLSLAALDRGGTIVHPDADSAGRALTSAERRGTGHDLRLGIDPDPEDPEAYPLVQVTYEVVCSRGIEPEQTALVKDFFTFWVEDDTQNRLAERGHVPIPPPLRGEVRAAIASIE